jgi:hypothetical protein
MMSLISRFHWFNVAVLAATVAGCGGAAPEVAAPPTATTASSARVAPAAEPPIPASWSKELTKEQQTAFMKKNVVPQMGPIFQGQNAVRYASFGCQTCHGPEYKNPHDYLPRLTMKGGNFTAFAEKPEVAKLMAESIVPKMASAMGLPPFDAQTHQGFGCAGCHAVDMK